MKIEELFENWKETSTILINGVNRPTVNSIGTPIANSKQGIINFYRWFGNSVCVDEYNRPMIFYHGTKAPAQPKEFKPMWQMQKKLKIQLAPKSPSDLFKNTKSRDNRYSITTGGGIQAGIFFSDKKGYAGMYGTNVGEYYLKIERPFISNATVYSGDYLQVLTQGDVYILQNELHKDGVIAKGMHEYIVFDSKQIKQVSNPGRFSTVSKLTHR